MIFNPKRAIEKGYVFNVQNLKKQLQPNGIDLTVREIYRLCEAGEILVEKSIPSLRSKIECVKGKYTLSSHEVYDIVFNEGCTIPENMSAEIRGRSSVLRSAGIVKSGLYDSGYTSNYLGAFLFTFLPITIEQNARLAQIIFIKSDSEGKYSGQWQNGKNWRVKDAE